MDNVKEDFNVGNKQLNPSEKLFECRQNRNSLTLSHYVRKLSE